MKVVIESVGKAGSKAVVGAHELVFDQPASVPGGQDRGPSPLDVMTVSIGACAHYFAAAYLHGRGLSPDGLTVEVTAEKERLPVARLGRFQIRVHTPAGLSERHLDGIERAIKSCPAYGTLLVPPSVEMTVEGRDAPAEAGAAAGVG
jgi:uncharacterized OsmC-like protein